LYLRFSEETYAALREQLPARGKPRHAPEVLERWRGRVLELNGAHSVRLLLNLLSEKPAGYFYASVTGERLGRFDAVVDERRAERLLVGQIRAAGNEVFYDVWTSFSPGEQPPAEEPARGLAYRIDTTILPTYELEATCEVELELAAAHQQVLLFELSRRLTVEEVAEVIPASAGPASSLDPLRESRDKETQPLEFFQNATLTAEEALHRGTDVLAVVLPAPHPSAKAEEPLSISPASRLGAGPAGATRRLRFRYRGQVITALGNGVFFVGARENWYPRLGAYVPAQYELRFRYPRRLELVATGAREDPEASGREAGEWKESVWVSEGPIPIAGFNLGEYESLSVDRGAVRVSVYGNRELEPTLLARVQRPTPPPQPRRRGSRLADAAPPTPTLLAPPSEQAARMAEDVGRAVEVFSELFGPFPYSELKVTQIPGRFGQGYPGLLYVSTLSFLEPGDLMRLGLRERSQEHFLEIVPAHETAHQWWGNWVQLPRYRDQWLAESLAAYSSLLYLEKVKGNETARRWLERYREDL
ncbi:MAG TPA: M1 family aminopeptidase, partial [Thermoanaerobaculia bacterium]